MDSFVGDSKGLFSDVDVDLAGSEGVDADAVLSESAVSGLASSIAPADCSGSGDVSSPRS